MCFAVYVCQIFGKILLFRFIEKFYYFFDSLYCVLVRLLGSATLPRPEIIFSYTALLHFSYTACPSITFSLYYNLGQGVGNKFMKVSKTGFLWNILERFFTDKRRHLAFG